MAISDHRIVYMPELFVKSFKVEISSEAQAGAGETSSTLFSSKKFVVAAHSLEILAGFDSKPCAILGFEFPSSGELAATQKNIALNFKYKSENVAFASLVAEKENKSYVVLVVFVGGNTREDIMDSVQEIRESVDVDLTNFTMGTAEVPSRGMLTSHSRMHSRPN